MGRAFAGTERYHVVRELGEGSFGAVYDVLDRERGAHVALKLLTRFEPSALYRFKAEFRAFADVSHVNLVQLYELGSYEDDWFFTMELVQGVDWLAFVREHAKVFDEAAATLPAPSAIVRDLAHARTDEVAPRCDLDRLYAAAQQQIGRAHV